MTIIPQKMIRPSVFLGLVSMRAILAETARKALPAGKSILAVAVRWFPSFTAKCSRCTVRRLLDLSRKIPPRKTLHEIAIMNRRISVFTSAAGVALSAAARRTARIRRSKAARVGLIGTGWYGKCDLFRLIQVAPVEVVSLCDVDKQDARRAPPTSSRSRQTSKKKPRTYGDYREMLKEKDLDIVLIATPDHWHALPMIAAVEAGADVYVQKPISVDVVEGQAMLAAARKHEARRAGRHAAPQHAASDRGPRHDRQAKASSARSALVEIYCYYHMRANEQSARHRAAGESRLRDVDRPRADAAVQHARPSAQLARVHGIRQRHRRRHVHPHARHGPLDARPRLAEARSPRPAASSSTRRARRTSPTRKRPRSTSATCNVVWQHRTWGDAPDPKYPWGATLYGDKGTLKVSVNELRLHAARRRQADPPRRGIRARQVSRGQDREGPGKARRPGDPPAHDAIFLQAIATRGKPVADIEQGHISTASCILANLSHEARPHADLGRRQAASRRRRRGEPAAAPAVSPAVGASGAERKRWFLSPCHADDKPREGQWRVLNRNTPDWPSLGFARLVRSARVTSPPNRSDP